MNSTSFWRLCLAQAYTTLVVLVLLPHFFIILKTFCWSLPLTKSVSYLQNLEEFYHILYILYFVSKKVWHRGGCQKHKEREVPKCQMCQVLHKDLKFGTAPPPKKNESLVLLISLKKTPKICKDDTFLYFLWMISSATLRPCIHGKLVAGTSSPPRPKVIWKETKIQA